MILKCAFLKCLQSVHQTSDARDVKSSRTFSLSCISWKINALNNERTIDAQLLGTKTRHKLLHSFEEEVVHLGCAATATFYFSYLYVNLDAIIMLDIIIHFVWFWQKQPYRASTLFNCLFSFQLTMSNIWCRI